MSNSLPIAAGIILEGEGERLGATCLAPGLIHVFVAFAASWPVRSGSHFGWRTRRVEKSPKMKVLRMKFSILENVPTPRERIFKLSPASQRPLVTNTLDFAKLTLIWGRNTNNLESEQGRHGSPRADTQAKRSHGYQEGF